MRGSGRRRRIAAQGNSAMARDSRDDGKCAEMRGVAGVIIPRARIAWTRAFCQNARGWFRVVFLGEAEMARRMIFVLTLGVLIGLAGAPAWRWLERSLFESLPVYSQLPDFELVDASGRKFTRERLSGKIWVADFIYTRCEDTCPLQTAEMRRLQQGFGTHKDFRQISITTDPENDKASQLSDYARKFGADRARWFFLTGKKKEIKDLALKGFRLSYATKQAALPPESIGERAYRLLAPSAHAHHPGHQEGGKTPGILITHSSRFVLIDRNFTIRGYYHSDDADSLKKLRRELRMLIGD